MQQALDMGDLAAAQRQAEQLLSERHDDDVARSVAAALAEKGRDEEAVQWYERLTPDLSQPNMRAAWIRKADLQLRLGQASNAQRTLQQVIDAESTERTAYQKLARLWAGFGLPLRSVASLRDAPSPGNWELADLVLLARGGKVLFTREQQERCFDRNPEDPLVACGLLERAWRNRDLADVKRILTGREPDLETAHHFARAQTALPEFAVSVWDGLLYTIGQPIPRNRLDLVFELSGGDLNWNVAVATGKVIEAVPWSVEANARLLNVLRAHDMEQTEPLSALVQQLRQIEALAIPASTEIEAEAADAATSELVELLCGLGRFEEADGWAKQAGDQRADLLLLVKRYREDSAPYVHPGLVDFDMTDLNRTQEVVASVPEQFPFQNRSDAVGLDFRFDNGATAEQEGLFMHQWTGGGVAVIDYDNDDWPDVWLTQGGQLQQPDVDVIDAMYRNQQGRRFKKVTGHLGIAESSFSQGVAAGDFNDDGFTDLYIANVGANQLLINQGDGTFVECASFVASSRSVSGDSPPAGQNSGLWTTSVAMADVTGDGIPDLYDVNYVQGDNVFTQTCDHDGRQRICGPTDFPACPDVLHIGDGSGGFRAAAVETTASGRGMGAVVGDILNDGIVRVFVANDESANQLIRFDASGRVVEESGLVSGLAVSGLGQPQGSMGIASGDFDRNGRSDLFVTNYYSEANNLYRQVEGGQFVDESSSPRLTQSGFAMLGFGCQFLDLNADGWNDLAVANGHLDDFSFQGKPYRMPTQVYANLRGELKPLLMDESDLSVPRLGRALVTWDWNRDGRTDLLLGDLETPVALFEHQFPGVHPVAAFDIVGTSVCRHPVGAQLGLPGTAFPQAWMTAGDGYQCTNQRRLAVAVLLQEDVHSVTVDWGDGEPETIKSTIDFSEKSRQYRLIQGRNQVYEIPR
ncbi:MAG: FG-GAP-like repeat-containing protein [Planctomycetaceae bacterium]|nr:FG-GAP-like repeat-containing protein [Planctomycetaceae bacterium]